MTPALAAGASVTLPSSNVMPPLTASVSASVTVNVPLAAVPAEKWATVPLCAPHASVATAPPGSVDQLVLAAFHVPAAVVVVPVAPAAPVVAPLMSQYRSAAIAGFVSANSAGSAV